MQIRFPFALCVLCAGLCSAQVVAAKIKSRGEIATVLRAFNPDDDARTDDFDFALTTLLDVKAKQGPFRQAFRAFARTALVEEERSIAFVQDAWIGYRDSRLELKAVLKYSIGRPLRHFTQPTSSTAVIWTAISRMPKSRRTPGQRAGSLRHRRVDAVLLTRTVRPRSTGAPIET